jgi:hypothetical protein
MTKADKLWNELVHCRSMLEGFHRAALIARLSKPSAAAASALARAERLIRQQVADAEADWAEARADEAVSEYDDNGPQWAQGG